MFFDAASEEAPESLLTWRFSFDNPTILGWTVVTVYFVAAFCSGRAALRSQNDSQRSESAIWWLFAAGLGMLGINKQLNLQTLAIVIGRNISNAGGWYGARRRVQLVFSVVFAVLALGTVAWFCRCFQGFFRANQKALAGAVVLSGFVVLRAASINHAFALPIFGFEDDQWAWVLEILGSSLIAAGALRRAAGDRLE